MSTNNLCFRAEIRQNNVYPCKPHVYYIKVRFEGSNLYKYVFVMVRRSCRRDVFPFYVSFRVNMIFLLHT